MELVDALVLVTDQQRGAVRIPVHREHVAGEVRHLQVPPRAGREVPDRRPFVGPAFVQERQPLITGHRGPRDGVQAATVVLLVADGVACSNVEDAHRVVQDVAVLGVSDAHQRAVRRQAADALRPFASHPGGLVVQVDAPGGLAAGGDVCGVAVVVG